MSKIRPTEELLDGALVRALLESVEFGNWFLSRTKFCGVPAKCDFCRSDNPWSSVQLEISNPLTGEIEILSKECETDVLAVFQADDGRRLGLHIENKLASGSFTPFQPELYRARMEQWKGRPKLGHYSEATTVLIAPKAFYDRFRDAAAIFRTYVSHEEIAEHIPLFGSARISID